MMDSREDFARAMGQPDLLLKLSPDETTVESRDGQLPLDLPAPSRVKIHACQDGLTIELAGDSEKNTVILAQALRQIGAYQPKRQMDLSALIPVFIMLGFMAIALVSSLSRPAPSVQPQQMEQAR